MARPDTSNGKVEGPKSTSDTQVIRRAAVPERLTQATSPISVPTRQVVVVLAMHRTGSSAITRALNLLGCDTAKTLMGPNEHNESGYWESDKLRIFNDRLLASGGSDWKDWQAFNPGWYQTPRLTEHLNLGLELLEAEFGGSAFFVFKDPRITRIMPFWRQLLAQAGAEPRVILTLRHPVEVAASLAKRDGISRAEAALIWLRNMLEAEHASRGLARAVVGYDQLLAAPSATMAAVQQPLGLIWPRLSVKVAEEIDAFISPNLRHHTVDAADGFAPDQPFREWLARTHSVLQRWSETGENRADWPTLDGMRTAMDSLVAPLREVVAMLNRQAADLAAQDKEVRYLRGEVGKLSDAVVALTAEKKALTEAAQAEKTALTKALDSASQLAEERIELYRAETEALENELVILRGEVGKLSDAVAALTAEKKALTEAAQAEKTARDQALDDLARLQVEHEALTAERAVEANETAAAMTAARAELAALHQSFETAETDRYDEIAELTKVLIKYDTAIGHLMHEARLLSGRIGRMIDTVLKMAKRPWLHGRLQLERKASLLRASGLFDAEWYLQAYPDVAQSGQDPATHFILFGRAEGRAPLPDLARFLAELSAPPEGPQDP